MLNPPNHPTQSNGNAIHIHGQHYNTQPHPNRNPSTGQQCWKACCFLCSVFRGLETNVVHFKQWTALYSSSFLQHKPLCKKLSPLVTRHRIDEKSINKIQLFNPQFWFHWGFLTRVISERGKIKNMHFTEWGWEFIPTDLPKLQPQAFKTFSQRKQIRREFHVFNIYTLYYIIYREKAVQETVTPELLL